MHPTDSSSLRDHGLEILGRSSSARQEILSADALAFLARLVRSHREGLEALLEARQRRQRAFDAGRRPGFRIETTAIREADWVVASTPEELEDRRVEITGPVDRKRIIHGLNSGARVFIADFEDSNAPTWDNCIDGQIHLRDAVHRTIRFEEPDRGAPHRLDAKTAILFVRPRGLHLLEKHCFVDGVPVPAAIFDFALFFFHNAHELLRRGERPCFYLPKLENHLEARWWNELFVEAQQSLGIPHGTIRCTVLIETLPAVFEMDEILYELKAHSAGLNCGGWDYIFSFIKTLRSDPASVLPDRAQVDMEQPFLNAYSQLLVKTCHRRNTHAIGGMAAQIPVGGNAALNDAALMKVRADKLREVVRGHDGTWVAHPGLVHVAKDVFDEHMPEKNQISDKREGVQVEAAQLLVAPRGTRSEAGLRDNIQVAVRYLESWLRGCGCVPLHHLMEDAATAEIARTQLWHWIQHAAPLEDGRTVTVALFRRCLEEELERMIDAMTAEELFHSRLEDAAGIFDHLVCSPILEEFLTVPAYEHLLTQLSPKE